MESLILHVSNFNASVCKMFLIISYMYTGGSEKEIKTLGLL